MHRIELVEFRSRNWFRRTARRPGSETALDALKAWRLACGHRDFAVLESDEHRLRAVIKCRRDDALAVAEVRRHCGDALSVVFED